MHPLVEELTLNAWPALQCLQFDGWVLNFSDGYTRRANSVNPIYPSSMPIVDKIAECEAAYARRGQETVFKICTPTVPAELDAALGARGYAAVAHTSVQVADLTTVPPSPQDTAITLTTELTQPWLHTFCALSLTPERDHPTLAAMLRQIIPAHAFATLHLNGAPVAQGLAVAERGYVGLFNIVVNQEHRSQGLGRRIVSALLTWAQTQNAHHAHLSVMCGNTPAERLYANLGFHEVYQYWYRARR
jgi:GNAT superfamily N-acetyltransferase